MAPQPLQNYIDNTHVATKEWATNLVEDPEKFIPVNSPANGEVIAYVPKSKKEDLDLAVESSKRALESWR
jgi:acyl-CoA reductase-like NAD-dependent aldehyde dehydrogenase